MYFLCMFISWLLSIIYRKCSWPCRFKANSMFFSIFCWRCEDRIVNITLGAIGNDYEWQVTKMKVRTSASINIFTKKEYSSKKYSWGEAKRQFLVDFSKHSLRNYFLRSVVSESTRTQSSWVFLSRIFFMVALSRSYSGVSRPCLGEHVKLSIQLSWISMA